MCDLLSKQGREIPFVTVFETNMDEQLTTAPVLACAATGEIRESPAVMRAIRNNFTESPHLS